jgi:hypothetical protein
VSVPPAASKGSQHCPWPLVVISPQHHQAQLQNRHGPRPAAPRPRHPRSSGTCPCSRESACGGCRFRCDRPYLILRTAAPRRRSLRERAAEMAVSNWPQHSSATAVDRAAHVRLRAFRQGSQRLLLKQLGQLHPSRARDHATARALLLRLLREPGDASVQRVVEAAKIWLNGEQAWQEAGVADALAGYAGECSSGAQREWQCGAIRAQQHMVVRSRRALAGEGRPAAARAAPAGGAGQRSGRGIPAGSSQRSIIRVWLRLRCEGGCRGHACRPAGRSAPNLLRSTWAGDHVALAPRRIGATRCQIRAHRCTCAPWPAAARPAGGSGRRRAAVSSCRQR